MIVEGLEPVRVGRVGTGIPGLDEVLGGGFPANRLHLVQGTPGTGKTTIALQFLIEGARRGERVLCVTLSETAEEMREVAASHGWSLDGVDIHEVGPDEERLRPNEAYTILHPADVELDETTWAVLEEVDRTQPTRVVFDSLAELRLLARDPMRYRRQILGLKQFFAGRHCTVLLLDGQNNQEGGLDSVAHSVVELEQLAPAYGGERRRLHVLKLRGGSYRGGYHDYVIRTGGLHVYPRLVASLHDGTSPDGAFPSGVEEIDKLLGGGLERGTSALLVGPAGVGKSVLSTQYALEAARRGEKSALFVFDESLETFARRSAGLGMPIAEHVASGRIVLRRLDPAQLSPGEFDHLVRAAVEDGAELVIIDSLNGYLNAMAEEQAVLVQLHELLTYLGQHGTVTIMTIAQHGLIGDRYEAPLDISYLADTVVLLRYFEAGGSLHQALSVVKKRSGWHERTIREMKLGPGVRVSEPLSQFQGVLTGAPTYLGPSVTLINEADG